jgi:hypothetical protein
MIHPPQVGDRVQVRSRHPSAVGEVVALSDDGLSAYVCFTLHLNHGLVDGSASLVPLADLIPYVKPPPLSSPGGLL